MNHLHQFNLFEETEHGPSSSNIEGEPRPFLFILLLLAHVCIPFLARFLIRYLFLFVFFCILFFNNVLNKKKFELLGGV